MEGSTQHAQMIVHNLSSGITAAILEVSKQWGSKNFWNTSSSRSKYPPPIKYITSEV